MSFMNVLKKINEKFTREFDEQIKQHISLTKNQYLNIYLEKVLGVQIMNHEDVVSNNAFNEGAHRAINSVSLCRPEIEFMHAMVDVINSDIYVDLK